MKQLDVAIVTDDIPYGEALMRGLRYRSKAFNMTIHSPRGFIERWKRGGMDYRRRFDLILWDGPEGERIRGENIVWITDGALGSEQMPGSKGNAGSAQTTGSNGVDNMLYRYDTASGSYARLMDILTGSGEDISPLTTDGASDPKTRVFLFGSWKGGAGCTTVCRAVGQDLTRFFGKRVIWMTMDGIETGTVCENQSCEPGEGERVDRCLYSILGRDRKKSPPDIERFLEVDGYGLATFRPSIGRNPLPGLGPDEIDRVLSAIAGSGFDALLIDAGTCCNDSIAEIMGNADRICLVGNSDATVGKSRYMSWMNDSMGRGKATGDRLGASDRTILAEDLPRSEGDRDILLEGGFGKNIHALTEALWYNEMDRKA